MKPTTLSRLDFLQALEATEVGLSPRDHSVQSSCYAFKGGRVLAFNKDVFARCPSGLPADFEGVVSGKPLLEAIRGLPDEKVVVHAEGTRLFVEGKRDTVYVHVQPKVLMPYGDVEKPAKGRWSPVEEHFAEGLKMAAECCGRDEQYFLLQCVHLTPKYLEASDNLKAMRYKVGTGMSGEGLIRKVCAKAVAQHGPTECQEGKSWLHFRNGSGVYVTVEMHSDRYIDMSPATTLKGEPTALPRDLADATLRLENFSAEDSDHNVINVEITAKRLTLEAVGVSGGQTHRADVKYAGTPVKFTLGPEILSKLVERHAEVEIARTKAADGYEVTRLIARSGPLFFFVFTGEPGKNGKATKQEKHGEK